MVKEHHECPTQLAQLSEKQLTTPYDCQYHQHSSPLSPPILCVIKNNNPVLADVFPYQDPIKSLSKIKELKSNTLLRKSKLDSNSRSRDREIYSTNGYNQDHHIVIQRKYGDRMKEVPLVLPIPFMGLNCVDQLVRYLNSFDHKCSVVINGETCSNAAQLNPFRYLINHNETLQDESSLLISNLMTKSTLEPTVSIEYRKDIYHNLKFEVGATVWENFDLILSNWYSEFINERKFHGSDELSTPYVNDSTCHNVVMETSYTIGWIAGNFSSMNIHLVLGNVPISFPVQVLKEISTSKSDSAISPKIHAIQRFSVHYVYEGTSSDFSEDPSGDIVFEYEDLYAFNDSLSSTEQSNLDQNQTEPPKIPEVFTNSSSDLNQTLFYDDLNFTRAVDDANASLLLGIEPETSKDVRRKKSRGYFLFERIKYNSNR